MSKYYLRYLIFLLPALTVSVSSRFLTSLLGVYAADALQWFFAFFLIIGYGMVTVMFAYRYPRGALSFILYYAGINLLIITVFYASEYGTPLYHFLRYYGGALSYVPLEIIVNALLDFNIHQEVFTLLLITGSCLTGYIVGLVHRRVSPDPYSPRIG